MSTDSPAGRETDEVVVKFVCIDADFFVVVVVVAVDAISPDFAVVRRVGCNSRLSHTAHCTPKFARIGQVL